MYDLLTGMRVIENASFVAGPLCGLQLLQLGAEVIRIDPIGGGLDSRRWPLSPEGRSFYWEGLNKGKKSVAIDLSSPGGQELAAELIVAPGPNSGLFLTNSSSKGPLSHKKLSALRSDLITVRVMGWSDGRTAVDYTINAAFGLPYMTGPVGGAILPINHVLPAWDLTAGFYATFSLLVAERGRRITGLGQEVKVPLSNIAVSCLANLGQIAEVTIGSDRMRMGNDLFGALGRDFVTLDNHRLMVVAITPRQWSGLVDALRLEKVIAELEAAIGVTFKEDEGKRFEQRDRLYPLIEEAIGRRTSDDLASAFNSNGVCWSRYRTLKEALAEDETLWIEHGLVQEVQHPSGHRYATPGAPGIFGNHARRTAPSAPRLGEHTDEVLANVLGLSGFKIGQLHDRGLIGGPKA